MKGLLHGCLGTTPKADGYTASGLNSSKRAKPDQFLGSSPDVDNYRHGAHSTTTLKKP